MDHLFAECGSLTSLDLTAFDMPKVTDASCMFLGCSGLQKLETNGFDTTAVTESEAMPYGCPIVID